MSSLVAQSVSPRNLCPESLRSGVLGSRDDLSEECPLVWREDCVVRYVARGHPSRCWLVVGIAWIIMRRPLTDVVADLFLRAKRVEPGGCVQIIFSVYLGGERVTEFTSR